MLAFLKLYSSLQSYALITKLSWMPSDILNIELWIVILNVKAITKDLWSTVPKKNLKNFFLLH